MFEGLRVLVTGGNGFIGHHLVSELLRRGARVRATLHRETPDALQQDVNYVKADLTFKEDCQLAVHGIDCVFMCAANTSGAAVIASNPLAHVTSNVVMNVQMLEAAYHAGVKKFVFISSTIVYPDTGARPTREEEAFCGDPYETYFSAGWMKRYGELLCRTYAEKLRTPMPTVVVRPSNVYGPHDKFDLGRAHVTPSLIRKVVEGQDPLEVWGTGDDVRDLIFIDDFIDGLLLATERLNTYCPINIASGTGYTVKEILETIIHVAGKATPRIVFDRSKPRMVPVRLVDIGKAKTVLGFSPQTSLVEGLRKTVEWYHAYAMKGSTPGWRGNDCSRICEKSTA